MAKIKLRCQIENLRSEVTCYVIDADTSNNLLLGRPWIPRNSIILSTLCQVMKYTDKEGVVRTLIAKKYLFKAVKNYFTDSLLYQDALEVAEDPSPKDSDSGNESDTKPEIKEECL